MSEAKFKPYTTAQLEQKEKQTKAIAAILLGLLLLNTLISISQAKTADFNPLSLLPFALFPIILALLIRHKNIKKEIERRKQEK